MRVIYGIARRLQKPSKRNSIQFNYPPTQAHAPTLFLLAICTKYPASRANINPKFLITLLNANPEVPPGTPDVSIRLLRDATTARSQISDRFQPIGGERCLIVIQFYCKLVFETLTWFLGNNTDYGILG